MMPWIIINIVGLSLDVLNILKAIWILKSPSGILPILYHVLGWLLTAFMTVVVWCYKKQLDDEADSTPVLPFKD